jgi:hypothetical protein
MPLKGQPDHLPGILGVAMAVTALLTDLWWRLRARRRETWSQCALCYEEAPEAVVLRSWEFRWAGRRR